MPTNAIPAETAARARALYAETTTPVARILEETGLTRSQLYAVLDGAGGTLPALPRRSRTAPGRRRKPAGDRAALIARLWRTADRQVRDIEHRLIRNQLPVGEREGDARALAVLVKTLRELSALDEARRGAATTDTTAQHDEGPRDIDEFRRELARKMDAFIAARTGTGIPSASGE